MSLSSAPGSSLPARPLLRPELKRCPEANSGNGPTLLISAGIDITDATGEYISYLASYLIYLLENQPPPGYDCNLIRPRYPGPTSFSLIPDPDNPAYDGMIYAYDAVDFPSGTDPLWTATLDTQLMQLRAGRNGPRCRCRLSTSGAMWVRVSALHRVELLRHYREQLLRQRQYP